MWKNSLKTLSPPRNIYINRNNLKRLYTTSLNNHTENVCKSSLDEYHKKLLARDNIPTLKSVMDAFNSLPTKSERDLHVLLEFMSFNHRDTLEILAILNAYSKQSDIQTFLPHIVRSLTHLKSFDINIKQLLDVPGLSAHCSNIILKALLNKAIHSNEKSLLIEVEKQLKHIDIQSVELIMFAYKKFKDVDGVRRWLSFGLKLVDDLPIQEQNSQKTRLYNYLIETYCMTDRIKDALHTIQSISTVANTFSFGCILKSLPHPSIKHINYSKIFQLMNNYNVKPDVESFNCVLWSIARRGRLEEIYKWTSKMINDHHLEMDYRSWNALLACWCSFFHIQPSESVLLSYLDQKFVIDEKKLEIFYTSITDIRNSLSACDDKKSFRTLASLCNQANLNLNSKSSSISDLVKIVYDDIGADNAKTKNLMLFLCLDKPTLAKSILTSTKVDSMTKHVQREYSLSPISNNISTKAMVDTTTLNLGILMLLLHRNPQDAQDLVLDFQEKYNISANAMTFSLFIKYGQKTSRADILDYALENLIILRKKGIQYALVQEGNILDKQLLNLTSSRWISPQSQNNISFLRSSKLLTPETFYRGKKKN